MAAAVAPTVIVTAQAPAILAAPAQPMVTGFTTIWGITINPMVIVLALAIAAIIVLFWRAQRDRANPFDIMDLVMEENKASKTAVAFLLAFFGTSWVIVDQEIKGTLSAEIFAAYLVAWVGPLTAKVIFNKTEAPKLPEGRSQGDR
jgi:hypothetical protein